ncbi:MAG: sulfatase [Candidatus Krumholzibacteria bacterium]
MAGVINRVSIVVAALLLLALVAAVVLFCRPGADKPPNVVLITVDTLRPDRLGYNGHSRPTSPAVDALAGEGIVFTDCYSVSGWTLPSLATLFTGRYPSDHGATDFHWSMDVVLPTMAGILRRRGYDTRGFVSHVILKPSYGVAEGFSQYDYSSLNVGHPHDVATARQLTDLALASIETIDEPFFLWVHYFDPHFKYLPHARWHSFGLADIDRYDQEIAHTDSEIARLLALLRKKKLYDDTVIIFTSDHGEEFGEHGAKYHYTLYEEVLRVPLIIKVPGAEPAVKRMRVEQIDLLPTVMALVQIDPREGEVFPGRNILATPPGAEERPAFFERDRPPPYNQRGILYDGYKLVFIERADSTRIPATSQGTYVKITNVHPGIYMYDLSKDPAERTNIYSDSNPKAKELLVMLAEHFSTEPARAQEVRVDDTLREKLRSLGYIQ